jgi:hypothetical protein
MWVSVFHLPDLQFQPEPSEGVPECSTWSVALSSSHEGTKKDFQKKKEYYICQFSHKVMAHQPVDTIATAFRMTSMIVRPTVPLE